MKKGKGNANYRHGMKGTRVYRIWQTMKKRCDCEGDSRYKDYGGRGIKYNPEWANFITFYKDMKDGYSD